MYRTMLLMAIILVTFSNMTVLSQQQNANESKVLATIGKSKITYSELERAFQKNLNRKNTNLSNVSRDSLMDFLNLYINFKLKVTDALARGYDKDSSVIADLEQNRKVLAESFYYDRKITDPSVNKYLKMREKEYKFAIILSTYMKGQVKDTLEAFEKITQAMNALKSGSDFATVAEKYSDDRESAVRGGVIPTWITSGKVQRILENAIYATKKGEIYPNIVNTKFGYFIVKVIDIQDRIKVKASHILITFNDEKRDSLASERKADSLIALLKKGANFEKLAKENSEDPMTAPNGGSLGGFYSRSTGLDGSNTALVPEFENAIYSLKENEISGKVHSEYGIHIIKIDATAKFDYEAEKDELKKMYKRLYYSDDRLALIDSVAKTMGFYLNEKAMQKLLTSLDTNKTSIDTTWSSNINNDIKKDLFYKFNGQDVSIAQFINDVNTKSELRGISLNEEGIKLGISRIIEPVVFNRETKNLEKEYPDFAALMNEFRDGILLFKIEAMEVWDKMKFDTTEARKFYNANKDKYKTDMMVEVTEVHLFNDSIAKATYNRIKAGEDINTIAEMETQRSGYREKKGNWDAVSTITHKIGKAVIENSAKVGDIFGPIKMDNGYSIFKVNKFLQPRPKTFEEAIPDFASSLQDNLQKNLTTKWLESIRAKNPVKIDEKIINEINKK